MFPSALKSSLSAIFFWALTAASTSLFTVLETAEKYLDSFSDSLEEDSHWHEATHQGTNFSSCTQTSNGNRTFLMHSPPSPLKSMLPFSLSLENGHHNLYYSFISLSALLTRNIALLLSTSNLRSMGPFYCIHLDLPSSPKIATCHFNNYRDYIYLPHCTPGSNMVTPSPPFPQSWWSWASTRWPGGAWIIPG